MKLKNRSYEDAKRQFLEHLGWAILKLEVPRCVTMAQVCAADSTVDAWMKAHRRFQADYMRAAGYRRVFNPASKNGMWLVDGKITALYERS